MVCFSITIYFVSLYVGIIVNPNEISGKLKRHSNVILKKKPGYKTVLYIANTALKIAYMNTFYVAFIYIIPNIVFNYFINSIEFILILSFFMEYLFFVRDISLHKNYYLCYKTIIK